MVDPNGLDKDELERLARERSTISKFDATKLSPQGYRVSVEDSNYALPSGEVVTNGTAFRNTFHLRTGKDYDTFIPCGGRPESVDISTVSKLITDKKTNIPYIVEGANLFLTQDAKLRLEKAGCIIFKDASANKGGVTSSSMEVLASLAFDDEGFIQNMCIRDDGTAPPFYQDYVQEVQQVIKNNAALEFEAIWREHAETKTARSILSDKLSLAITKLDEELQNSELWLDLKLRRSVLSDALPKLLLDKLGFDTVVDRVPQNYLRSIFGSYLASRFVYEHGSSPGHFAFFDFMRKRMDSIEEIPEPQRALEDATVNGVPDTNKPGGETVPVPTSQEPPLQPQPTEPSSSLKLEVETQPTANLQPTKEEQEAQSTEPLATPYHESLEAQPWSQGPSATSSQPQTQMPQAVVPEAQPSQQ